VRPGRGADSTTPSSAEGPIKSIAIPLLTLRACMAYNKGDNLPKVIMTVQFVRFHKFKIHVHFILSFKIVYLSA